MDNLTGQKLTHMTHAEDLILMGENGASLAYNALEGVYNTLKNNPDKIKFRTTRKIDGSPSVIAASNYYGKTFVATKGFFAKEPKYATTEEECSILYGKSPDLEYKMKSLLKYIPFIDIPENEIWQGDFLFSDKDLKVENIEGEEYITFHPNTIIYSISTSNLISKELLKAKIGVAWHTVYRGPDFNSLKISFDADVDKLNKIPEVFQIDARLPQIKDSLFTEEESSEIEDSLAEIKNSINAAINSDFYKELDNDLILLLNTYRNYVIKKFGSEDLNGLNADRFMEWINNRFIAEADKKKTQTAKDKIEKKRKDIDEFIMSNGNSLDLILKAQDEIRSLKNLFVDKLDNLGSMRTFVQYEDGKFVPTGQEGYAVSDDEGNVQKYVKRTVFSANNFNPNIKKGWDSERRQASNLTESISDFDEDLVININAILERNNLKIKKDDSSSKRIDLKVSPTDGINRNASFDNFMKNEVNVNPEFINPTVKFGGSVGETPILDFTMAGVPIRFEFKPLKNSTQETASQEKLLCDILYRGINENIWVCTEEDTYRVGLDSSWSSSITKSVAAIRDWLLNKNGTLEGLIISREGYVLPKTYDSIHNLINKAIKSVKDIFGTRKDSWNPSDIYVCYESSYNAFKEEWEKALEESKNNDAQGNTTLFNSILSNHLNKGDVVGISLKKVTDQNAHISLMGDQNALNTTYEFVLDGNIVMPDFWDEEGNPMLDALELKKKSNITIQFNTIDTANNIVGWSYRQPNASCTIETKVKGGGARNGRYPSSLWNGLAEIYDAGSIDNQWSREVKLTDLTPYVSYVEDSGLPVYHKNGNPLNVEDFMSFAQKVDSLERTYVTNLYPRYIKFLYMMAKAYANFDGVHNLDWFLDELYRGSSKNGVMNAPYIKVY